MAACLKCSNIKTSEYFHLIINGGINCSNIFLQSINLMSNNRRLGMLKCWRSQTSEYKYMSLIIQYK